MKKIINTPETVVRDMCEGLELAHPDILQWDRKYNIILRKRMNPDKVCLISGGGSGHEPAHAGFVGKGMLDAAVCGDVFASPSTIQVYNAILKTKSKKGTLLIIKNYTGDCLNFEGAMEMAAEDAAIDIRFVHANDDVAVKDSDFTVGRRGVAGTLFVHKIAGAAAEEGANLEMVKVVAEKVIRNVRSMGFALTSCTVPAKGKPTFSLGEDEIEFGVGIHGEAGTARKKIASAGELAEDLVGRIAEDLQLTERDETALLVNGLGGTPLQELYILNTAVRKVLQEKKVSVYNTWIGNFMTSLDMAGASISLLKLDDEMKHLLDAQAETPALKVKQGR